MDRGDVLSGAAFSAVLRSAIVFIVVLVLFGWAALSYVERNLITALGDDVQQRWNIIAADLASEGQIHTVETIRNLSHPSANSRYASALFGAADELIAGNILTRPKGIGLQVGPLQHNVASPDDLPHDYIYIAGPVAGSILVVGQRLDLLDHSKIVVFRSLTFSGFLIVLIMLSVGYVLSHQSLRQLRDIENALSKTSEGDTAVRISGTGGTTQIDRIARQMNLHLDQLSRMIVTTRNTAAAAAHDLKSPLGRAYLSLEKAMEHVEKGDDPTEAIADTQVELENMRVIFDSYLQLSRIEAAGDDQLTGQVDFSDLAKDLADTFALIAEDEGQNLSFDVDETQDYRVMGDGQMLQQMVVNLLQNAITHGAEGNTITISLGRAQENLCFAVADRGPGIADGDKERVFEPFYRLDPSRTKPGSGLGLALVRAIAERHGGAVTLRDNHPGLIVEVTLPRLTQ